MKKAIAIVGAGGFGREIMPLVTAAYGKDSDVYFVDDAVTDSVVGGVPRITEQQFFELGVPDLRFNVAIGDSKTRAVVAERMQNKGALALPIHAENMVSYLENEIEVGSVFCANTIVTSNVKIGKFFQCNLNSYIAHDSVIGNFVTFAPGVHCNGNVHIGDFAYIGTGAIIKQGTSAKPLTIGEGAVVGMGAVVTKDVAPHTTVIGNPARPM